MNPLRFWLIVPALCTCAIPLLPASAQPAAQRFYAFEAVSPAAISAGSWAWGDDERPLKLDGFFGVNQRYKAPGASTETLVSTPLCLDSAMTAVGHAFAKKLNGTWKAYCRTASGATSGVPLLKPTGQQLTRINFIPFTAGSALPRYVAPIARDSRGLDVYPCRVSAAGTYAIGTLQPNGKCKTAPGYLGAPASAEATSFEVMVTKADATPAVGWIYLKSRGHHPGGTLVTWPGGTTYCQGRANGLDSHGFLETNADGSVDSCTLFALTGAISIAIVRSAENVKVFRNDAQSGVGFESNTALPVVGIGNLEACAVFESGAPKHRGVRPGANGACITPTGVFLKEDKRDVRPLRRKGNWPDQG